MQHTCQHHHLMTVGQACGLGLAGVHAACTVSSEFTTLYSVVTTFRMSQTPAVSSVVINIIMAWVSTWLKVHATTQGRLLPFISSMQDTCMQPQNEPPTQWACNHSTHQQHNMPCRPTNTEQTRLHLYLPLLAAPLHARLQVLPSQLPPSPST